MTPEIHINDWRCPGVIIVQLSPYDKKTTMTTRNVKISQRLKYYIVFENVKFLK